MRADIAHFAGVEWDKINYEQLARRLIVQYHGGGHPVATKCAA